MNKKTSLVLLIAIIALGSLLRIYKLGSESFWIDEFATVYTTRQNASDIIKDIYTTTRHAPEYFESGGTPPFYYVVANYWTKLIGLSEAKLRLLSALFGIISIYIMFLIGRALFEDNTGLIASFIFSINYLHINYSQESRTYSLGVLLTLLSVYFLLKALRGDKKIYWGFHILSSAILIYTHYFGAFILIFEYSFLLLFFRSSIKNIFIAAFSILLFYAPWIPALIRQTISTERLGLFLGKNIPWDLAKIFVQFNSWFTPDFQTRIALREVYHSISEFSFSQTIEISLLGWFTILSVVSLTLVYTYFFISSAKMKKNAKYRDYIKDKSNIFVLMWFLTPICLPILITLIKSGTPIFGFVQYTLFASPAYYLIISNGLIKSKKYYLFSILIAILSVMPLYSYYSNFDKQQWREASDYLNYERDLNELIIVNAPNNVLPLSYYYGTENIKGVNNVDELISKIKNEKIIWLVYASEVFHDPKRTIKTYLDANYKLEKRKEFTGIKIYKYSK